MENTCLPSATIRYCRGSTRRKSFKVHGHIHADTSADFLPLLGNCPNVFNAGVDINGFVSVTFDELMGNNNKFKTEYMKGQ